LIHPYKELFNFLYLSMNKEIKRQDIPGLVIIAIIGAGLTFLGLIKLNNAAQAKKWPTTIGTITSSVVGGAVKYYPSINYTYTIDGIAYTSNRISTMNFNTKKRSVAEEFLKKYPGGSEVKVYYNKEDPAKSLLEPGINTGNILLVAFGVILLAIPVLLVFIMKKEIKQAS
jgi:hypothetical protein